MQIAVFIAFLLISYLIFWIYALVYPNLPEIRLKRIQLFPSIKIRVSGKIIYLHHWFNFLIILTVSIFVKDGLLTTIAAKGFFTGGIIHGITLPNWKKLILKNED